MEVVKGYKAFNSDWTCYGGFQYEVGKMYEMDSKPILCENGFHFCKELVDCFNHYDPSVGIKVAEVFALGDIVEDKVKNKCCTNKIRIVREISWEDVLKMVNIREGNTGRCNIGHHNSGNYNSGNYNSGNYNSGNYNSGNYNSGICNIGSYNSGNCNTGDFNSGCWNSGDYNSGDNNSGDWNSGDYNSGDWNKTSFSNGCFNTKKQNIVLFNKPSDWTYRDWLNSNARYILNRIPSDVPKWILSGNMTDEEKSAHPEHETTGGYLKMYKSSESKQMWWNGLAYYERDEIMSLPNFDTAIFKEITGIDATINNTTKD